MNDIGALLPFVGSHSMLAHLELTEMIGFVRALGDSYRLAASEPGSSVVHGRFAVDFVRTIVACLAR